MAGIFSRYRSGHEFLAGETIRTLAAFARGTISAAELRQFVLRRDERGDLEMDSATFAVGYIEILVEVFPDARFILTIRDPYSWLNSFLNMVLSVETRLPLWLVEYGQTILGPSFTHEFAGSEHRLSGHLSELVDSGLAYWSRANGIFLATLPADRTLIVRTQEISSKINQFRICARWLRTWQRLRLRAPDPRLKGRSRIPRTGRAGPGLLRPAAPRSFER